MTMRIEWDTSRNDLHLHVLLSSARIRFKLASEHTLQHRRRKSTKRRLRLQNIPHKAPTSMSLTTGGNPDIVEPCKAHTNVLQDLCHSSTKLGLLDLPDFHNCSQLVCFCGAHCDRSCCFRLNHQAECRTGHDTPALQQCRPILAAQSTCSKVSRCQP